MEQHQPFLITGAGGQIGKALRGLLDGAVFFDSSSLDIRDRDAVASAVAQHSPRVIINPAAYTKVDLAEDEAELAMSVNGHAVEHLAQAADAVGALLVQVSTDYVFDGTKAGPYLEDDDVGPLSVYGRSKLSGEQAASTAKRHLVVRTSWVFGDGANFVRSIVRAAATRDQLEVVEDQIGRPTHAGDLAQGLLRLVEAGATGTYHLTNQGEPASWAEVAETALIAAGSTTKVKRVTTDQFFGGREGPVAPRPRNSVLDCSKAAELGVRLRPWKAAVVEYVKSEGAA